MTDRNLIWTRILVGIDQSTTAQRALHTAIDVTRHLGGELIIVSAYQPIGGASSTSSAAHSGRRRSPPAAGLGVRGILDEAQRQATEPGVPPTCVARHGPAAEAILGSPTSAKRR